MTKQNFIALADAIREQNKIGYLPLDKYKFNDAHLRVLADFCQQQNPNFKRQRWLDHISGHCGKNGGAIKR